MLDPMIIEKLREKYPDLHPLLFHRSVERAKSNGHLFDILSTIPDKFPLLWNEELSRWVVANDLFLKEDFFGEIY